MDKGMVVKALQELSVYLQLDGENAFKTRAYDVAAERLAGLTDDLAALVQEGRLKEVPGIGESIARKVAELVTTGKLGALEEARARYPAGVLELLSVPDLGPKKIKALVTELQVGSLDELEKACQEHRVRGLKGFGQKTEEKLLHNIAVARQSRAQGARRVLADVLGPSERILAHLRAAPGVVRASLAGSVRRRRETVADVDVIASAPAAEPVFAHLKAYDQLGEWLGSGDSKASVRLTSGLQVDVRVLPDEDFATALHHFTGSKAHHIHLRGLAQQQGYTLSEWGVHRLGKGQDAPLKKGQGKHEVAEEKVPIADEDALYRLLGLEPIPPELREDWGEIEAARAGTLPRRLLSEQDIKGNIHSHTVWSDGRNTLEEMALAARALGYQYFTVTEHSQTSGYAGGLTLEKLKAQWEEIARVQEKVPQVRLLKGIESDILDDGRLDYPDEVLAQLDLVICSIHQRHGQDEAAMTRRVLHAMDNPFFHIWGHPTGRLLLKREPAPLRMEEVLDKAAEKGVVLEVNGQPERLDLSAEHVRLALKRGLKLVVASDAHSVQELKDHLPFAVANARRGWATAQDVLNTRDAPGFLQALRTR